MKKLLLVEDDQFSAIEQILAVLNTCLARSTHEAAEKKIST